MRIMRYGLIGFAMVLHGTYMYGMDEPVTRKLDLSGKELPVWNVFQLNCEKIEHLLAGNASLLESLVGREQGGCYCPELGKAETVLRKNKDIIFKEGALIKQYNCNRSSVHFVRLIANKNNDRSLLITALEKHDYNNVCNICKENPYVVNAYALYPEYGGVALPLHYALYYYVGANEEEQCTLNQCIKCFLNAGACANAADYDGNTPLHKASTIEHIRWLWRKGADKDKKNNVGITPAMKYLSSDKQILALFLVTHGANTALRDNNGNTLLHYAVRAKHAQLVDRLLCEGKQFEIHNECYGAIAMRMFAIANVFGETPADLACGSSREVQQVMQEHMLLYLCNAFLKQQYQVVLDFIAKYDWINYEPFIDWAKTYYKDNFEKLTADLKD